MVEINNKFYISRNILATCFIKRKFFSTQPPNTKTKSFYSTSMKNLLATHLTAVIKSRYTFNFMFTFLPSTKFEIDNSQISKGKLFDCTFNDLICFYKYF